MLDPLRRVELSPSVHGANQPPHVDRVEAGVGAVGGAGQLAEFEGEIQVGKSIATLRDREKRIAILRVGDRQAVGATEDLIRALPPRRERVEVIPVAHVDDRLAPVLDLLELPHQIVGGGKRCVRAEPEVARTLPALGPFDDVGDAQPVAFDPADQRFQQPPVVAHVQRHGRRSRREEREQVAFMDQRAGNLLQHGPDMRRIQRVEMEVIDEQQEDPARRGGDGPRRRQDDALRRRQSWRRLHIEDAAAVHQQQRRDLLRLAVLEHHEIVHPQIGDKPAVAISHDDVGGHQLDVSAKDRLLGAGCRRSSLPRSKQRCRRTDQHHTHPRHHTEGECAAARPLNHGCDCTPSPASPTGRWSPSDTVGGVTVTYWFASGWSIRRLAPFGHKTSIASISVRFPSPK